MRSFPNSLSQAFYQLSLIGCMILKLVSGKVMTFADLLF
jgi:hypothetical protein